MGQDSIKLPSMFNVQGIKVSKIKARRVSDGVILAVSFTGREIGIYGPVASAAG
jgi:hypothetical protein